MLRGCPSELWIKADAFSGCMSLKEIELPSTLKSLSNSIVSCPLESITLSSSTPPTSAAFPHEIYLSCVLNVPLECIETYQSASPWNNFWNLQGSLVPIESVLFDEDTIILDINETKMLQPIISPANATNKELEWACSDPSIVSVSEAGTITSSTREGEAMITAYACDGSGVSATIKVVVQNGAGISDILADESFSVSVRNGSIIINGKRDSDIVEIFNLHGQLITSSTDDIINLSAKGIYLVKSGSRSKKVIL